MVMEGARSAPLMLLQPMVKVQSVETHPLHPRCWGIALKGGAHVGIEAVLGHPEVTTRFGGFE